MSKKFRVVHIDLIFYGKSVGKYASINGIHMGICNPHKILKFLGSRQICCWRDVVDGFFRVKPTMVFAEVLMK